MDTETERNRLEGTNREKIMSGEHGLPGSYGNEKNTRKT